LREFHRVLSPGGLAAVSTLSARHLLPQRPATSRWKAAHHPSAPEMRRLFEDAGFTVAEQHRVRRPLITRAISDLITVGIKS
jgi:ubiquinone/menaquinone biosynthesis C-methylase UbiE